MRRAWIAWRFFQPPWDEGWAKHLARRRADKLLGRGGDQTTTPQIYRLPFPTPFVRIAKAGRRMN